jgi:probable F420-dependent oxidoreductase
MNELANISIGAVLPHRTAAPVSVATITRVAQRAEALGFADLWVTENTLDRAYSFEPMMLLTHAGAVTSKIRLGVSVMVLAIHHPLQVAHQCATLDYLSGGRAILGVGIGRDHHYNDFGIAPERRIRRFNEALAILRGLWTDQPYSFAGDFYEVRDAVMSLAPVQRPHLPIWIGAAHPDGVRRAARIGDGWMGAGSQPMAAFEGSLQVLRDALGEAPRNESNYPISKRVFMTIDENAERARDRLRHWFGVSYGNESLADTAGVFGTMDMVREKLTRMVGLGVNHLLLNPVDEFEEQLELCAQVLDRAP